MQGTWDLEVSNVATHSTSCSSHAHNGATSPDSSAAVVEPQLLFNDAWAKRLQLERSSTLIQATLHAGQWDAVEDLATSFMTELQGVQHLLFLTRAMHFRSCAFVHVTLSPVTAAARCVSSNVVS